MYRHAHSAKSPATRKFEVLEHRQLLSADGLAASDPLLPPGEELATVDSGVTEYGDDTSHVHVRGEAVPIPEPVSLDEFRSFDGTGNNIADPLLGNAGTQLLRAAPAEYADGISELAGADRPSAREVSNALAAQDPDAVGNSRELSAFVFLWGQFLDHDIDLTESEHIEYEPIEVPTDDPFFDPDGTGNQFISFFRSIFDTSTGDGLDNPREQINQITAFIDGSQVYGSDQATADSLRSFVGGRMLISDDGFLPTDSEGSFLAGDIRANENISLTAMHTLFVREHNWWAGQIAAENPALTDEEIFQRARAIVVAELQVITFEEFLPALLGRDAIAPYAGYDPTVDPGITNEFSTAAFRMGHSLLNDEIDFIGNDGREVLESVALADAFFNPGMLLDTGIDSLLKSAASSQSQEVDPRIVDSVRNFLFGVPGAGGLDLASLNIQRGRDHGLADYNSVREAYGLQRVTTFAEITSDLNLQTALADMYITVDDIDLWVGALAEDHVGGSSVGELTQTILADQFSRLRDGDRFWYQNSFSAADARTLEQTRLSDIIQRNTEVTNLQRNVFFMSASISGTVFDNDRNGLAGVTVELLNGDGDVVDATVTNKRGRYRFTGLTETGDYQVRVLRPTDFGIVAETRDVLVSRGDLDIDLDFGEKRDDRDDDRRTRDRKVRSLDTAMESDMTEHDSKRRDRRR